MLVMQFLGSMRPEHDGVTRVAFRMRAGFNQQEFRHLYVSPLIPAHDHADMFKVSSLPFPLSTGYRLSTCSTATIRALLIKHRPDVVHIHSPCTLGFRAIKAARSLYIPTVSTFHTNFPAYLKYYKVGFLQRPVWKYLRSLYNSCQGLIVPSSEMAKELASRGLKNLHCIPHGVDTAHFSPQHRSPAWRDELNCGDKVVVSFIGRLVWEKNLKLLAEALALVKCPERIQMVVIGDGPARAQLELMMPRAKFLGQLGLEQVAIAYASSDIFVLPSVTETFGNVTIEAMASGLAPICAAAGGACDLIQHESNGLLVNPQQPNELARAIERLASDSNLRQKLAVGALHSSANYQWSVTFERYENLYRELAYSPAEKAEIAPISA